MSLKKVPSHEMSRRIEEQSALGKVASSSALFLATVVLQLDPVVPALVWPLMFSDICSSLADPGALSVFVLYVAAYTIPISSITPIIRPRVQHAPTTVLKNDILLSLSLYAAGLATMTTSHAWWAVIFGRVLTGIGAAGLYAALPVAAEIMAEVSSGQATSETVLPWNLINVTAVNTGRIVAIFLAIMMSIGVHWRYIIAAGVPLCLLAILCGTMIPTTPSRRLKHPTECDLDAHLAATFALVSIQAFVVAISVVDCHYLMVESCPILCVPVGSLALLDLGYALYCLPLESILVLHQFMGLDCLTSLAQGALATIIIHFGLWYAQASALDTSKQSAAFLASALLWNFGYHCAALPVAFPSVHKYLSTHDLVISGGCLTLFGSFMVMYDALDSSPLRVSFWIGVCGLGVGLLDLYLLSAPLFSLRQRRTQTCAMRGVGRTDVVGFTQSLTWNYFGQLVGICVANRVFMRYFGVLVDEVLEGDRIATHITGLLDAKQALIVTQYLIPDIFPGLPAMYRPPILRAMGIALGVAVPMVLIVLVGSSLGLRGETEIEIETSNSEVYLAGFLTVLPEIDNELPVRFTAASSGGDGEKMGIDGVDALSQNRYGTFY